jgi:hypothetical protein
MKEGFNLLVHLVLGAGTLLLSACSPASAFVETDLPASPTTMGTATFLPASPAAQIKLRQSLGAPSCSIPIWMAMARFMP